MRIKLDENLSLRLKTGLAELGHDADTVRDEQLTGKPDGDVWAAAQADRRFLVTLDGDFSSRPNPGAAPSHREPACASKRTREAASTARRPAAP